MATFTLKAWVNRASTLALAGEDLNLSPVLDPEEIAETYAHQVMFEVAEEMASDPLMRPLVTEAITISLTNGVGTLPSRVLTKFLIDAILSDPADATVVDRMVFLPWEDFIRAPIATDRGYFSVRGQSIYLVRPGAAYAAGAGMTGNISLSVPAAFDMPASEGATIAVPLRVEIALVDRLAQKLIPMVKPQRRVAA